MESLIQKDKIDSIEDLINTLPGITSSKIITNESKEIIEVHVLSDTSRNPKQISRDIQSAITAKFGISIDHKKISIAQIEGSSLFKNSRLKIESINYSTVGNLAKVQVVLMRGDEAIVGNSTGPHTSINSYRLIATAAINCIHNILDDGHTFVIEDIEKQNIAKREVITVAVNYLSSLDTEELLVGSAVVKKDIKESIVRATLDAINRKIIRITQ